ncbi:MAG: ATP-binding protein [Sphingorhabdus sp.]|uniref:ATP-binding protein n=1 Tax=Sphingorhabdus sp. TaxID=1902408 RepID=UPI00273FDE72|nr:ATP-binding protein [Sphingorhabdus sp.]MDP4873148.1 ATP-binding protein [Sphingorhabdus sp.]
MLSRRWTGFPAIRDIPKTDLLIALLLGVAGLFLNTFELKLGWGTNFVLGNALVYVFVRVLAPQSLVFAVSVSSIGSIILWNNPWGWIVSVCEAAFIAVVAPRSSPVRSVVLYWIVAGAPLLFFFYGGILIMDQLSVALLVAKQIANGILNVVLGEIIYVAILGRNPFGKFGHWPKIRVECFTVMLFMGTVLIPTTVYMALDAPSRERATMDEVNRNLESHMSVADAKLSAWVDSRAMLLRGYADNGALPRGQSDVRLPKEFSAEFQKIAFLAPDQSLAAFASAEGGSVIGATRAKADLSPLTNKRARLVALNLGQGRSNVNFALVVPHVRNGQADDIVAILRPKTLHDLVEIPGQHVKDNIVFISPAQGIFALTHVAANVRNLVGSMSQSQQATAFIKPVFLRAVDYDRAITSDLRDSQIVRLRSIAALPDWQVASVLPLGPAVLKARAVQLLHFLAVITFVFLIGLLASHMSLKASNVLRRVSQSAADLTQFGRSQPSSDHIFIEEVSEISGTIAMAAASFGRERGALASYQRRLNSIAQHAPIIVYAVDVANGEGTDMTYVSPSLEQMLGYSTAEGLTDKWWSSSIHPDDYDYCMAAFRHLEPGKVYAAEYRLRHKNGSYVWVYDTLSVEPTAQGAEQEAVGIIMDISEQKAFEDQLLQSDKMASLGRMMSGTAHELNQPLNFIKLAASNLRENAVRGRLEAEKFIPKLENIVAQVERASAILLQMRIFGRTSKEAPSAINVQHTVEAAILMAEPQMELDGTQLVTEVKASGIYVRALPVMLEQVLLNLFINANDAIRSRHDAGDSAEGEIKITIDHNDRSAFITVADNGPGIPPDVLPKIFEPFFTTKPPKEGTGLGLSISHGIIRDMGGVLRAETSRKGARFTIELPLADATATEAA